MTKLFLVGRGRDETKSIQTAQFSGRASSVRLIFESCRRARLQHRTTYRARLPSKFSSKHIISYTMPPNDFTSETNFSEGMTGSCLCGGITIILKQDIFSRPNGHICYCDSCRKSTGTSGLNSLSTTKDKVEIRDPEGLISTFIDSATDSGRSVERHFCSRCGR